MGGRAFTRLAVSLSGTTVYGSMCNERGGTLEDSHGEDEKKSLWKTEDPRCPTRPIARAQTPLPHDASESLEASLEAQVTKTDATVGHHWRTRAVLAPRLRRVGWLDGQTKTMDRKGKPELRYQTLSTQAGSRVAAQHNAGNPERGQSHAVREKTRLE